MMVWRCSKLLSIKVHFVSYLGTVALLNCGWYLEIHFYFLERQVPTVSEIVKRSWMEFWEMEMPQSWELFVSLLPLGLELDVLPLSCCESWTRCAFILLFLHSNMFQCSFFARAFLLFDLEISHFKLNGVF